MNDESVNDVSNHVPQGLDITVLVITGLVTLVNSCKKDTKIMVENIPKKICRQI